MTERTGATAVNRSVLDLKDEAERTVRDRLGEDRWARAYTSGRRASIQSLIGDLDSGKLRPDSRPAPMQNGVEEDLPSNVRLLDYPWWRRSAAQLDAFPADAAAKRETAAPSGHHAPEPHLAEGRGRRTGVMRNREAAPMFPMVLAYERQGAMPAGRLITCAMILGLLFAGGRSVRASPTSLCLLRAAITRPSHRESPDVLYYRTCCKASTRRLRNGADVSCVFPFAEWGGRRICDKIQLDSIY